MESQMKAFLAVALLAATCSGAVAQGPPSPPVPQNPQLQPTVPPGTTGQAPAQRRLVPEERGTVVNPRGNLEPRAPAAPPAAQDPHENR
jgi:hypothetical protein